MQSARDILSSPLRNADERRAFKSFSIWHANVPKAISSILALHDSTQIHRFWGVVGNQNFLTFKMVRQVRVKNSPPLCLLSSFTSCPQCTIKILSLLRVKVILILMDSSLYYRTLYNSTLTSAIKFGATVWGNASHSLCAWENHLFALKKRYLNGQWPKLASSLYFPPAFSATIILDLSYYSKNIIY